MNKKIFTGLALIILAGTVSGLELSMQDVNGSVTGTEFDVFQPDGFYSDFPENFERPEEIGSYSFTDNSLVSPNIYIDYESSEDLTGERIQIFYSSVSGNLTRPVSTFSAPLNGSSGTVDMEVSSFEAVYPGKIYGGLKSENGVENLTEVSGGVFSGNFTVRPTSFTADGETFLSVEEALNSDGEVIHDGRSFSDDLLVSIIRDGEVMSESAMALGEEKIFDTRLRGGDEVYVNGLLALKVEGLDSCGTFEGSDRYYVISESIFNAAPDEEGRDSCIRMEDMENSVIDFAGSTVDGTGNFSSTVCGLRVENSSKIDVRNAKLQEFSRGLCIENSSEVSVEGVSVQSNGLGVYSSDSEASVKNVKLVNNGSEVRTENSETDLENLELSSAEISVSGLDFELDDVSDTPPDPSGTENLGQWINLENTSDSGLISNLSFSVENADSIYKSDNSGGEWSYTNLSASSTSEEIFLEESVNTFSVFAPYREVEETEEPPEKPPEDGGGSGGGGGGGGGGGFPPGPPPGGGPPDETPGEGPPDWVPAGLSPEDVPRLELESGSEKFEVQQGRTFEANFSLAVQGNVSANDVAVNSTVRDGWAASRDSFDEILPGENVSGGLLMDVYQSEIIGEYNLTLKASTVINDTFVVLANETVTVEVLPRGEVRDLEVLEAPYRMNLTENSVKELDFDLKNSGDFRLENIEASLDNTGRCMEVVSGSENLDSGSSTSASYSVATGEDGRSCEGAFVFSSENSDLLAVAPVKVNILERPLTGKLTSNILPVLVLVWTVFTLYWVRRRFHEE